MAEEKLGDRIMEDVKHYVDLRVDGAKLAAVEGLSSIAGSAIAFAICLFLVNIAFMLFSGVFLYLINLLVHSWVCSALILGGTYMVVGILVALHPGAFRNMMVRVFAPMFFCCKKHEEDDYE